jgi:hypothetical protein
MMPVFFIWGFAGMAAWVQPESSQRVRRIVSRAWLISVGLVLIVFWVIGARAYSRDVAVIESEMVDTAGWIASNTDTDVLIAAHDIGALGYFGERNIIDLAGLVSPEVIPFIRNESLLADYLDEIGADYLVTFPGWYPSLVNRVEMIYSSGSAISPRLGGENMQIFRWSPNTPQ